MTSVTQEILPMDIPNNDFLDHLRLPVEHHRTPWDQVWIETAKILAGRSYDPRFKVGAVIVTEDNTQVLAVGYNGDHRGGPNSVESTEPGQSGFIHAEINALIKCDFNHPKAKKMYLTLSPCRQCAKAIINGGIREVVYDAEYRDTSGIELLKSVGIVVRKHGS
jgi:dCMP deaminase